MVGCETRNRAAGPGLPGRFVCRSRDQLYGRFGYLMGMKQALALLTGRDATLH